MAEASSHSRASGRIACVGEAAHRLARGLLLFGRCEGNHVGSSSVWIWLPRSRRRAAPRCVSGARRESVGSRLARDLMEVVVHRLAAAVLAHQSLPAHSRGVGDAERDGAPDARVGGVADVGALGEALAHRAHAVDDAHRPHAAAQSGEADLEGEIDADGAVLAQQEGQRLEDRLRRGGAEAVGVDLQMIEPVAQIPARDRGDDRLERATALGDLVARPRAVRRRVSTKPRWHQRRAAGWTARAARCRCARAAPESRAGRRADGAPAPASSGRR